jgi:DNA-3-methyladenine glycosylase II
MKTYVKKLVETDPAFRHIVEKSPLCTIALKKYSRTHFETIVVSIASQQLSSKAADTIIARVKKAAGGSINPARISKLEDHELRECGLSFAKIRSIREFTHAVNSKVIRFHTFPSLSNAEISEQLTAIWGIGRWTVEMFLIFHLGRLDLWPVGDLAVRRGWEKIHRLSEQIAPKDLEVLGEQFAGYQSVVAWYCWRATEGDSANW